ncbi:MAG: alkaline phosphatase family protein [Pirellulales bacterium]|nr:alkaline phosphatase family protein [Pirellulales bacterium]
MRRDDVQDPGADFSAGRVLVIGLDGATFDVLGPLTADGTMPHLAALMRESALVRLNSVEPTITPTAWTTFQTGCDPVEHAILDYRYLDHRAGQVRLNSARRLPMSTIFDRVSHAGGEIVSINLPMTHPVGSHVRGLMIGGLDSPSPDAVLAPYPEFADRLRARGVRLELKTIWKRRPTTFEELRSGVRETQNDFRARVAAAELADEQYDWRLMVVQFQSLDCLQHRLWHLLGIEGAAGGPSDWIEETRRALRTLDDCLGALVGLAERRGAAVMVASDHGFGPFREKISLPELLRRRGLWAPARASNRVHYRLSRVTWKLRRWMRRRASGGGSVASMARPAAALLPVDWQRTAAVTLHGNLAGLVYLATPDRFGAGGITNGRLYDEAAQATVAAFREAAHPETGEPLFTDAFVTAERWQCDPLERCLPDVVAIPAEGFHTRPKLDRWGRLMRSDPTLAATHRREGVLMLRARGVELGKPLAAELRDAAPTILDLLGIAPGTQMTGQSLRGQLTNSTSRAAVENVAGIAPLECPRDDSADELSAEEQAQVEDRLRELGYIE